MKKRRKKAIMLCLWAALFIGVISCNESDPEPKAPFANAGQDQQAEIGSAVILDASGSSNPDGNDLKYQWSFISKPATSGAAIIGIGKEQAEFVLDKAGTYYVKLTVSNSSLESSDSLKVTNKTPVLSDLYYDTEIGDVGDYAQKGEEIYIHGNFFSMDINENEVRLGGIPYQITEISANDDEMRIEVIVPEEAVDGDLEVTVGAQTVKWPNPVKIMHFPVKKFIDTDNTMFETERDREDYKEIGTLFKPLVNGKVLGFGGRLPDSNEDVRITLWDATSKTVITSQIININDNGRFRKLDAPVTLEAGKEYLITFIEKEWYYFIHSPRKPIFPREVGNIEILKGLSTTSGIGHDDPTPLAYPEAETDDFIVQGPDIVFVADVESIE